MRRTNEEGEEGEKGEEERTRGGQGREEGGGDGVWMKVY